MGKLRHFVQRFRHSYTQYIEKHGLGLIITACVATIAGSAAWTHANMPAPPIAPALPVGEARSAAELLQESLADAMRPTASPTPQPSQVFRPPVDTAVEVLSSFDGMHLQQSPVTGLWLLHDAVDIAVKNGEQVFSISDGIVVAVTTDSLHGECITVDHGNGVNACYMGLKADAGLQVDDPVSAGQLIGFGGSGMRDEDEKPHLHLRVTRNGEAIDPIPLWNNSIE